jgi:DNA-binding IclR family transcriptional regulator
MFLSELSREYSKNNMYIHRLLSSLESVGWVSKDPVSQKYAAGDDLVTFGLLLTCRFSLPRITLPYLYELADITNETTALSVRIGYERVWVQEIPAKHDKHRSVILGQRYPLWIGASGKSMAAYLSDAEIDTLINIRRRDVSAFTLGRTFNSDQYRNELKEIKKMGYSMSVGEYRPDVCVLAAPIIGKKQSVLGSIVVRGTLPSFSLEKARKYSTVILEMANNINREVQGLAQVQ